MDGELSVNITVIIKEETLFTGILHLCLHLFFSSCHFPNSFPPDKPFLCDLRQPQKPFQSPRSRSHTRATTLQFCWRPLGLLGFSAVMNCCVTPAIPHERDSSAGVYSTRDKCCIELKASSEWAHSVHFLPIYTHTHHFKKIPLLMAPAHTHSWCVSNIYWMFDIFWEVIEFL